MPKRNTDRPKDTILGRMHHAEKFVALNIKVEATLLKPINITLTFPGTVPDLTTVIATARDKAIEYLSRRHATLHIRVVTPLPQDNPDKSRAIAAAIFGVTEEEVTDEQVSRTRTAMVNLLYGGTGG